jgi:hypothetical protein
MLSVIEIASLNQIISFKVSAEGRKNIFDFIISSEEMNGGTSTKPVGDLFRIFDWAV